MVKEEMKKEKRKKKGEKKVSHWPLKNHSIGGGDGGLRGHFR